MTAEQSGPPTGRSAVEAMPRAMPKDRLDRLRQASRPADFDPNRPPTFWPRSIVRGFPCCPSDLIVSLACRLILAGACDSAHAQRGRGGGGGRPAVVAVAAGCGHGGRRRRWAARPWAE